MSLLATRRDPMGLPSPGGRQSKGANMSMERALRSIASPKRPPSAQKKSRKSMDVVEKANEESVKVAIRIRPLSPTSQSARAFRASLSKNSVIETLDSKPTATPRRGQAEGTTEYSYDNVFGEETDTAFVYGDLVQDIVASVANDGVNGTVFTYGQTSSGKTFTMQGCGGDTSGVIQMAAKDIFDTIRLEKNAENGSTNSESTVKVSYVEIYNEELRDLLIDNKRKTNVSLNIREDKRGSITVENLKEVAVRSVEQLMEVFRVGEANKSIGSTKMNDRSSRSHAILKITIEKKTTFNTQDKDDKENNEVNASPNGKTSSFIVKTSSTLNLVDLGIMLNPENSFHSLLTLSKVLMSLGQKNPGHVNYRDSKLTRILKPSLSGNARMAVICCISPSDNYIDETRSTLQFASRAKLVKTNAEANEVVECQADVIAKLRLDLERSRLLNESLETQIRELQSRASESTVTPDEYDDMRRELDNLKTFLFDDSNQSGHRRVVSHSNFFTDQDTSSHRESIVKDDMCVPLADKEDEILRMALAAKAKQVEELQEELNGTQNVKKPNDLMFSMAAYQEIDKYKSQAEDLEAKLMNANNLISSLGRQIDELSSQKNDALDWIEELFAKSELKDKQVNHANRERDDAIARCSSLASEMAKTKQLLEFTIGEKEDATSRMKAMKTEVDALKYCVNANNSAAQGTALLKEEVAALERNISELKSERDELATLNDELRHSSSQDSKLIAELQHANHMLKSGQGASDIDRAKIAHLTELNEELRKEASQLKHSVQSYQESNGEYDYEKEALLKRIDLVECELSDAKATSDAKSEELDDMVFSFESERRAMTKEISELRDQIKADGGIEAEKRSLIERAEAAEAELSRLRSSLQTKSEVLKKRVSFNVDSERAFMTEQIALLRDQIDEYKNENRSLLGRAEMAENELEQIQTTLQTKAQDLDDTAFLYESENESLKKEIADLREELNSLKSLKEDNMKLKSEQSYMKRRIERCDKEADELRLGRMQLKMAQRAAAESSEVLRLTEERMKHMEKETHELRIQVEKALQRAARAEKANTDADCERMNSVVQANRTVQQLRQTQKELSSLKQANLTLQKRDKDLRESVSRVRELVDSLASENANLKEKSEGYSRKLSEQENRNRELDNLLRTLMAERDSAVSEANEVKLTFRELKEANKTMQSQYESLTKARNLALLDKEKISLKMDKMAADFEADYETLRHKVDDLIKEKEELENQVAMLEAGKASIELNADRILERDNALSGEYDKLKAELKTATKELAESEDEINQLTRRLDYLKNETERLERDNAALNDAMKVSQAKVPDPCSKKRKTLFDFMPGET